MSAEAYIPDPFDCYELTVQSPRHITTFLRAVHGNHPIHLREDFAGTAAVSRQWITEARRAGELARAIAVELDPATIARAKSRIAEANSTDSITLLESECIHASDRHPADLIFVGNFSIGYIHTRADLLSYLTASRERLARGNAGFGGGIFACDTYGGASAFKLGGLERRHPGRRGEIIRYSWLHEKADPLTHMVENSISFRVEVDGEVIREYPHAFTYHWRLWSIAELREAMLEAGFTTTEVYKDVNIAPGQPAVPIRSPFELGEEWIVLISGRT